MSRKKEKQIKNMRMEVETDVGRKLRISKQLGRGKKKENKYF